MVPGCGSGFEGTDILWLGSRLVGKPNDAYVPAMYGLVESPQVNLLLAGNVRR